MATTELGRPRAHLELPGSGSATATLEVVYQPRATRLVRTVLILAVTFLLMPVVFFFPPHLLWPALVLLGGLVLARLAWVGEYYVSRFEGACPRCGTKLDLKPGSRIRSQQTLECFGCHRRPELILESAVETAEAEGFPQPAPDVERRRGRGADRRRESRRDEPASSSTGDA